MAYDELELDPSDYWTKRETDPAAGDLCANVPLFSRHLSPAVFNDEFGISRAFFPTKLDLAVLFRKYVDCWWFLPFVTADSFEVTENFETIRKNVGEETI